jgi:hypothetical protein
MQRAEIIQTKFKMRQLTEIMASPDQGSLTQSLVPGWSGDPVEPWRITCRYIYWYHMATIAGRATLTKEDTTFADWVGAYVDLSRLKSNPRDFTQFWLYDVNREAAPATGCAGQ